MVEFAFGLVWGESNGTEPIENNTTKDESESAKFLSGKMRKEKVQPLTFLKCDLKEKEVFEGRQTIFRINIDNFFAKLTPARKIDFSSFAVYHATYVLFNFIYFLICTSNNHILE